MVSLVKEYNTLLGAVTNIGLPKIGIGIGITFQFIGHFFEWKNIYLQIKDNNLYPGLPPRYYSCMSCYSNIYYI